MPTRALPLAPRVPIAQITDRVLNVDGSLAIGFELTPLPHTSTATAAVATLSLGISELIRNLPDGFCMQHVVECVDAAPSTVTEFASDRRPPLGAQGAAALLAEDAADFVASMPFRTVRQYLFICHPYPFQNDTLVRSGALPLAFPRMAITRFERATKQLEQVASACADHLRALGIELTRSAAETILGLTSRLLNPGRSVPAPCSGAGHDPSLFLGTRELDWRLTLREQLIATDFEQPTPQVLVAGDVGIRTLSLKTLPDQTTPGMLAELFFALPAPYILNTAIEKLPAERTLAGLKVRRSMAQGVASLAARRNIDAEVQHAELEALMESLSASAISLCALQVTCAVFGRTEEELWERSENATQAFSRAGGLGTLIEDYNHLDVYMSQLPGASHRFRRSRTVTDLNAAHMLVPFGSWRGHASATLMLRTRAGDAVAFDPFADELPAYNGLIVGATGSGKSFFTNLLLANSLAAGGGAVVVDIGGSYRRLTQLFGGTYLDVGQLDSIGLNPLPSLDALNALPPDLRDQKLQFLAGFLELLLSEDGTMGTAERALIAKLLSTFYSPERGSDPTPPTLDTLQSFLKDDSALERDGAQRLVRRLDLWTRGPRARLFQRHIDLDLQTSIISIDLKAIEADRELQAIALYVLGFVVWSKLAEASVSRRNTLVVFDECWALLASPPAQRLIENLARTSRKYGAGLWCLSQALSDFSQASIGPALLTNAYSRILLRHPHGHEDVAEQLGLNEQSLDAFRSLTSVRGKYAEIFLQSGPHAELLQVVPSPIAYWMATTNAKDRSVEHATREKNPSASPLRILRTLAERFPNGV
ncbi:MAG: DUF87 domain-containing protein [Deltaproteobacteria bacterium]|nr:DUF87 domain-containing protein [Deltaproteobacteria bacterium]